MIRNGGRRSEHRRGVNPDLLGHLFTLGQITRGMNPIQLTQILGHSSLTLIRALHLGPVMRTRPC